MLLPVISLQFTPLTCYFQYWSFLYNNTCNCNKGGGNEQWNSHTSNHSCKPTDHRTHYKHCILQLWHWVKGVQT